MTMTSIGFDIFAKDNASDKFDHLGNKIDGTQSKFSKIGQVAKVAGLAIAAGVGVAAVAMVDMTKAAIEDDAAQQKLAVALKNSTGATDAQVASAEKWISAQGVALGVTDDELRPALQRLAESTGDVGKAQKQLEIAMDVSAGTGKSLKSVTEAMMKANNGSVGGLSKLGVATKDAAGETLGLNQIMKNMANTFEGQAAAKADTLQGKMDILKLRFDEAKETIGAKLIPVLTTLADWILGTGVPAVEKFIQGWKDGEGAGGQLATAFDLVKTSVSGTVSFLNEHRAVLVGLIGVYAAYKVAQLGMATASAVSLVALKAQTVGTLTHSVVSKASAVATGAWTAAQWLLNAALTANPIGLVVVALAALGAALVIAWNKSETFRAVITAGWDAIKNATGDVWDWVKEKISTVFNFMKNVFLNFTGPGLIIKHWDTIKEKTIAAWDAIKDAVGDKIENLIDKVRSVKDKTVNVFSNAANWLVNEGRQVISGLIGGIGDKFEDLGGKMGAAKDRILNKFEGAVNWLLNEGRQVIGGLIGGMGERFEDLGSKITAAKDRILNKFEGAAEWLMNEGRQIIGGLIGGVGEKFDDLGTKVGSIKEKVTGYLSNAGEWLYNAGSSLVQGLINGITSKIAALGEKMSQLASKIKSYLPGSPVKTGPLTSWNNGGAGKRLVGLLADGLENTRPVDQAMNKLLDHASPSVSLAMSPGAQTTVAGTGGPRGYSPGSPGGISAGGDTYNFHIHGATDPEAVVEAIQKYVRRNGPLRNVTVSG